MRLAIQSVADRGNLAKERLVLKVRANTEIGEYVVIQSGFNEGGVTIAAYNTYWFPYKEVDVGDQIVLYTKSGRENEKELKNGKRAHFFYWGIPNAIWSGDDRAPVLLHAPEWISKDPGGL